MKDLTLTDFQVVTKNDIRNIKSGTKVTFTLEKRKQISSIRNMASLLSREEPSLGVVYSCSADYAKSQITISAKSNTIKK